MVDEKLYMYLSILPFAISLLLVWEDAVVQKPIYYMSKILRGVETIYAKIEKLVYALVTLARQLRPYF